MVAYGNFTIVDSSKERARTQIITGDVTAVSIAGVLTDWGTLRAAVDGIVLGTIERESLYVFNTKLSNVIPSNSLAQVENKWLVFYEDTTQYFDAPVNAIPNAGFGKIFTVEIGTADLQIAGFDNLTETVDLTVSPMSVFVSEFEGIGRSPYGGVVNVLSVQFVGRGR